MMVKYLVKRKNNFWYRRRIKGYGEVVFSLKTQNYDVALYRHSYISFKIKQMIYKGVFELMTIEEVNQIIDKYKNYMLTEEYNEFEDQRDEDLTVEINGKTFGGHTKEALKFAIDKYQDIHSSNNFKQVQQETAQILERSNITKEDLDKIQTPKDEKMFHWELFKAEWELLYESLHGQKLLIDQVKGKNIDVKEVIQTTQHPEQKITKSHHTIESLANAYIEENRHAKEWSDKNERDIKYVVIENLSKYYPNKNPDLLTRKDFSSFRDNIICGLPTKSTRKIFRGLSPIEVVKLTDKVVKIEAKDDSIPEEKKLKKLSKETINKHLRRIHQVFEWAYNADLITKNLTKDLKLTNKHATTKQKTARYPYNDKELDILFNKSMCFTDQGILTTLRYNPHMVIIPLLALFTGAKNTELATLKTSAFIDDDGILGIDFNQMIKTVYSERFTPLSQILLDIGIMKFVKYRKKNPKVDKDGRTNRLFPEITIYEEGTQFTNHFSKYNREYIDDPKKTFYSFRHLVNQRFKDAGNEVYIINDVLGHSMGKDNKDNAVYGDKQSPSKILKNKIDESLVYDVIDFEKIKKAIDTVYG
jgi:site-specific recombinase XerD